jgi:phosphate:Na+ symporter
MEYGFVDFLQLLGALCVFIYGMKVMSDGIQKAAGDKLRSILKGMTSNRVMGILTGFLITVILQTSSGTTVMVVSFVNAGLLTLAQSIGVIMGANIGTTLTAWMIAYFGFKVDILTVALPLMGISLPFYFGKNKTYKNLAEFVIGFGILFIGIDFLKQSVPDIKSNPEILSFITEYTQFGYWSILMFVFFGTLLTIIVQSSSAASAITLTLISQGIIDFEMAAAIFLGENIGTTITANIAAIVGNVHAKRAARFHFLFNVIGVTWVLILFIPVLKLVDVLMVKYFGLSPFSDDLETRKEIMVYAIATFHTLFNTFNVLLFVGLVPWFEKLVIKMQPGKKEEDDVFKLEYIGSGLLNAPELSVFEVKREVITYTKRVRKMYSFIPELLQEMDKTKFDQLLERIQKYEDIVDRMEVEIAEFLVQLSEDEISDETSNRIRALLRVISNLEKIGDVCYQSSLTINRKNNDKAWFTQNQRDRLKEMFAIVNKAFDLTLENIQHEDIKKVNLTKSLEYEKLLNNLRNEIRDEHFVSVEKGDYNIKSGLYYNTLYTSVEKIGDHIYNINEALAKTDIKSTV